MRFHFIYDKKYKPMINPIKNHNSDQIKARQKHEMVYEMLFLAIFANINQENF